MDERFVAAVQSYWNSRDAQLAKQVAKGGLDTGARSSVTGGGQMAALEALVVDRLIDIGLPKVDIYTKSKLQLPGYFRAEKKWDLLVVSKGNLVCAIEFKSHAGPSFGNNVNNRVEEAIGNALDVWTAYRENIFKESSRPFLGYFLLLEDCPKVHGPVKISEPHYPVDAEFKEASYARRYELLCQRLVHERHYDAACMTLTTRQADTKITHPSNDLSFEIFMRDLLAAAGRFVP